MNEWVAKGRTSTGNSGGLSVSWIKYTGNMGWYVPCHRTFLWYGKAWPATCLCFSLFMPRSSRCLRLRRFGSCSSLSCKRQCAGTCLSTVVLARMLLCWYDLFPSCHCCGAGGPSIGTHGTSCLVGLSGGSPQLHPSGGICTA